MFISRTLALLSFVPALCGYPACGAALAQLHQANESTPGTTETAKGDAGQTDQPNSRQDAPKTGIGAQPLVVATIDTGSPNSTVHGGNSGPTARQLNRMHLSPNGPQCATARRPQTPQANIPLCVVASQIQSMAPPIL